MSRVAPLLEQLDPGNLSDVLAVYEGQISSLGECEIRPFVDAWTRFDALGAFERTLGWRFLSKREIGVEAAIHGWALRNPAAARVAVEQTAEERPRFAEPLFASLVSGWVHSGQGGVVEYLRQAPGAIQGEGLGVAIGAELRQGGIDGLEHWSDEFIRNSDPTTQAMVFRRTVRAIARMDPARAIAWLEARAGHDYAADGHRILAEEWVQSAPLEAFDWIRTRVPEERRDQAVKLSFGRWLSVDWDEAKAWLESESRTLFHDPAIEVFARRLAPRSPREAIGWCERSLEQARRLECLTVVAWAWYRKDRDAAAAWLQDSPLDEETRQSVRDASRRAHRGRTARADVAGDEEGIGPPDGR